MASTRAAASETSASSLPASIETGTIAATLDAEQAGKHTPARPRFCAEIVTNPLATDAVLGSPESQTHPLGQGVPPTTHTVVQKPRPVSGSESQLHAPELKSVNVHAAPMARVRATGWVVQRPTSV
jgi:hypothetical protein